MKRFHFRRLTAIVLSLVMVLGMTANHVFAIAERETGTDSFSYEKLDPDKVSAQTMNTEGTISQDSENQSLYSDTDTVRVMIVLEEEAAISLADDSEEPAAENEAVSEYCRQLAENQEEVAEEISAQVLDGEALDVNWNLTLIANAISANIEYGQISAVEKIDGVKAVYLETKYDPAKADVNNIISQHMTHADAVHQESGYTGAGSRIAVIDTGTDSDHQSFSEAGYLHSLKALAEKKGVSYEEYADSLNLLGQDEIAGVLEQLNAYSRYEGLTAEDLYLNEKLPFAFNYVDGNLKITHDEDDQGEHGSHVAGIAAANSYIDGDGYYDFDGDGDFDQADAQALMDYIILGTKLADQAEYRDLNGDGLVTTYDVYLVLKYLKEYEEEGAFYIPADTTVGVTGTAPDAQLITMKVFGENGGAYSTDYMAAMEDAVLLGCDVVNLSLGSAYAGYATSHEDSLSDSAYVDQVMEDIAATGTVMCVSAGNSGKWADNDDAYQLLYTDEAGSDTVGEPSTFKNALSVASVDNTAVISSVSNMVTDANGNGAFTPSLYLADTYCDSWESLDPEGDKGVDYDLVFVGDPSELLAGKEQTDERIYAGSAEAFEGCDYTGKIVLVARGMGVYFSDKHTNAALAGAKAVLIYNNESGYISPSIEGTQAAIPCAGISYEDAQEIYKLCTKNEDGAYSAKIHVTRGLTVTGDSDYEYPSLSDFSSWGAPGSLTIKPEIAAPGGSIYSVNGATEETDAYEAMSGTSMASPHVAGLTALASQYINEQNVLEAAKKASGREDLTERILEQSLLMSTAVPLIEESSLCEYSVRGQGAGFANIENVVNAESFVLVDGQDDGKVKAEFGDGGENGWSFTFSLNNLTDQALTYDLSASVLTSDTEYAQDGENTHYLTSNQMTALGAEVVYSGANVAGDQVTVPAGGSASVTVTVCVTEEAVNNMRALGYTNGFFTEGYVYVQPEAEGGVTHSIPMLGWYGNWTDPSMYDTGSYLDTIYGTAERPSHINSQMKNFLAWEPTGYGSGLLYTGNIYGGYSETEGVIGDQRYLEARNAINSTEDRFWSIYGIAPTLIRNAADCMIQVVDRKTGEVYYEEDFEFDEEGNRIDDYLIASFYYTSYGQWVDTTTDYLMGLGWDYTGNDGQPLPDGTEVSIIFRTAPDYYVDEDGMADWTQVGRGTDLSFSFTVDNTAPDLADEKNSLTLSEDGVLNFTVQDNNYVAAVVLLNGSATSAVEYYYPDMDEDQRGQAVTGSFDLGEYQKYYGNKAAIAVCDYAGNQTYYALNLGGEGASYGELTGFQYDMEGYDEHRWVSFSEGVAENETQIFISSTKFVNAEYVNGYVFAQTESGDLYAFPYEDMLSNSMDLEASYVTRLERTYHDLAYNYSDGMLYGLYTTEDEYGISSEIYGICLGESYYDEAEGMEYNTYDEISTASYFDEYFLTLACDDNGTFYLLEAETYPEDETVEENDAILWTCTPVDYGYYTSYQYEKIGATGYKMNYLQSMTWDHNKEGLYWSQFYPASFRDIQCNLFRINPETADCEKAGTLSSETAGLFAPLTEASAALEAHQNVPDMDEEKIAAPTLSVSSLSLNVGGSEQLTCSFDPWYSKYKEVVWSSSDESVASVTQDGVVTGVAEGNCTITVASAADPTLTAECAVNVASLSLELDGIVSTQGSGVGNVANSRLYTYTMTEGLPEMADLESITADGEFAGYGLSIASSVKARGSVWACEFGNSGMIYQIDEATGEVVDMLEPIDGDMMFGLTYSEVTDNFAGIMNYHLYVDQPFTHEASEEILDSYDEEQHAFTWHRFDMTEYLNASAGGLVTQEDGDTSIVFSAITSKDGGDYVENTYRDYLGKWDYSNMVNYTPDTTLILLDNVGRLWYIDEITGLNKTEETDEWSGMTAVTYMSEDGMDYISGDRNGVMAIDNKDGSSNVFVIRQIVETPFYDMFLEGRMPGITYHFSDMYYTEDEETGTPMIFFSLYDYWNSGTTNQLYLYLPGELDPWSGEKLTPDELYGIGNSGEGNIIATINSAKLTGGLDLSGRESSGDDWYGTYGVSKGIYRQ